MASTAAQLAGLLAAAVVLHLVFLAVNAGAAWALRLAERDRRAVVLLASQKTLPIAVAVVGNLDVEAPGLLILPCVLSHVTQLFIDAAVAGRWRAQPLPEEEVLAGADG